MPPFASELAGLTEKLLTMASYAESGVRGAVQSVVNRDDDLASRVRAEDEVIDRFEIEVDELAIMLLARAPLASDLRLIAMAMKISQNLERVGDEASKIAKRAADLNHEAPLKLSVDIPRLANQALEMLKCALDAFVNRDPIAARALVPRDKDVDALNKQIHRQLASHMVESPESIPRCLNLMVVAKSLERIADHAKNIAEEVVYFCEARDIRHTSRGQTPPASEQPRITGGH